jgi:hypothetical protein
LANEEISKIVKYDGRLTSPLDFVCKILGITKEDFVTLSIANLLDEALDWIKHNNHNKELQLNEEKLESHHERVKTVKYEADSLVLK